MSASVGDRIRMHSNHTDVPDRVGTVVAVRGEAEKAQAQIDFGADIGLKWLLLRYAPVEKL